MGTKGTPRKFFFTLQPNTILNPNPDPNAHVALSPVLALPLHPVSSDVGGVFHKG